MQNALTREEVLYLRSELLPRFGAAPSIVEGFILRSWKSGPVSGSPRVPSALRTMIGRGLAEVRQTAPGQPFRAYLTPAGLLALAEAVNGHRSFPPKLYSHVREELDRLIVANSSGSASL